MPSARGAASRRLDETEEEAGETYRNGDLAIDFDAKVVVRGDDEIHLTPIEYKLLVLLAHNTGKVLTHNYILKEVWGAALASDLPSLRVFMATLRKKIEPDPASPVYLQTHVASATACCVWNRFSLLPMLSYTLASVCVILRETESKGARCSGSW